MKKLISLLTLSFIMSNANASPIIIKGVIEKGQEVGMADPVTDHFQFPPRKRYYLAGFWVRHLNSHSAFNTSNFSSTPYININKDALMLEGKVCYLGYDRVYEAYKFNITLEPFQLNNYGIDGKVFFSNGSENCTIYMKYKLVNGKPTLSSATNKTLCPLDLQFHPKNNEVILGKFKEKVPLTIEIKKLSKLDISSHS